MKIYTKTGDCCTTCLIGGTRVPKNHPRLEAYGTADELMAQIACLRDGMADQKIDLESYRKDLLAVLDHLMRLCCRLAADENSTKNLPSFGAGEVEFLEERIDDMQASLPPIRSFTLPGGHPLVSLAHVARTICRRCERRIVELGEKHTVDQTVYAYINRLSDYLYTLGRKLANEFSVKELIWQHQT